MYIGSVLTQFSAPIHYYRCHLICKSTNHIYYDNYIRLKLMWWVSDFFPSITIDYTGIHSLRLHGKSHFTVNHDWYHSSNSIIYFNNKYISQQLLWLKYWWILMPVTTIICCLWESKSVFKADYKWFDAFETWLEFHWQSQQMLTKFACINSIRFNEIVHSFLRNDRYFTQQWRFIATWLVFYCKITLIPCMGIKT